MKDKDLWVPGGILENTPLSKIIVSQNSPVPENCPELSTQTGFHQHVQVLAVFECPVEPVVGKQENQNKSTTQEKAPSVPTSHGPRTSSQQAAQDQGESFRVKCYI